MNQLQSLKKHLPSVPNMSVNLSGLLEFAKQHPDVAAIFGFAVYSLGEKIVDSDKNLDIEVKDKLKVHFGK